MIMETTKNEFMNYNTWSVMDKFFKGVEEAFKGKTASELENYVEDILVADCKNAITCQLAFEFLLKVKWKKIRRAINEEVGKEVKTSF